MNYGRQFNEMYGQAKVDPNKWDGEAFIASKIGPNRQSTEPEPAAPDYDNDSGYAKEEREEVPNGGRKLFVYGSEFEQRMGNRPEAPKPEYKTLGTAISAHYGDQFAKKYGPGSGHKPIGADV